MIKAHFEIFITPSGLWDSTHSFAINVVWKFMVKAVDVLISAFSFASSVEVLWSTICSHNVIFGMMGVFHPKLQGKDGRQRSRRIVNEVCDPRISTLLHSISPSDPNAETHYTRTMTMTRYAPSDRRA